MGDVHGAYNALKQCMERAAFDYENDLLVNLGDVCDGWPQTRECIDELLKVKNLIYIFGNHDYWALDWMIEGKSEEIWLTQGGEATVRSYDMGIPEKHIQFLQEARAYYILEKKLFVHAGINPLLPLEKQGMDIFLWDRNLAKTALDFYQMKMPIKLTGFDEVYLGHTPIPFEKPIRSGDVWLMDTGAGWSGRLSMMDIDTYEIFSSDVVPTLYPGIKGRSKP
jgi:serine/threonine protein phosphatase 1